MARGSKAGVGRPRGGLIAAGAAVITLVAVGVALTRTHEPGGGIDGGTTATTITETPATASMSVATTPSTTAPDTTDPAPMPITRPIIDPAVCTPLSASEGAPSGLPRDPTSHQPLTLFARPSEMPVPIQIIGDPVDGQAKGFAVVQRYFDRLGDRSGALEPVVVDGVEMHVRDWGNRNGEAEWTLPDGSVGYLRSRDLTRDQIVGILSQLTPRAVDAPIPGFDVGAGGPDGLGLVAERMNTEPRDWRFAGSQCLVEATGRVYRIVALAGDAVLSYAAVIDRPIPAHVGIVDEWTIIISGLVEPGAPTTDHIVDADEQMWRDLLAAPPGDWDTAEPIAVGVDVPVPFVPLDDLSTPISSLTLRIEEPDGVAFLEIYMGDAVIADAAEYWKIEVDGKIRGRSSARPGEGKGVIGQRLGSAPFSAPFRVQISTTDGDDLTIQTTGIVNLTPVR